MSDTFTQLCNLDTLFPVTPDRNWAVYPNIVYYEGTVYGGYSTGTVSSLIYRFNANDPNGNKATLTDTKFNYIKSIVVDATNVYCFSSNTPKKIYSIPLLFDASSNITDIDLSGVTIPSSINTSAYYYMVKTSTDFYITCSSTIYRIPISSSYTVSNFSSVPNDVVAFDKNTITGKLYALNTTTNTIYSMDPSGVAVGTLVTAVNTGATVPTNTGMGSQMEIYDNKIFLQYKTTTSYYLGINNIGDISFNSVVMNTSSGVFSGNNLSYLTINTDSNKMYVRQQSLNPIIYTSTDSYCFNKGTKILCMNNQLEEEYINIELLQIGDFVKTYKHGYRKVSRVITGILINNPKKWNMCMYKMAKTPTNRLIEDLIVTGGHSLLVDAISDAEQKKYDEMGLTDFSKITIDNKRLLLACVSDQFYAIQDTDVYTYYHLLLENNDDDDERFGIWANGILTETPNEKNVK